MPDAEWIDNIKKIVIKAVESGEPCNVLPGTVTGIVPLAIQIDQKITLTGPQLLLTRNVTDHIEQMSIPGIGNVSVTVKNGLKTGEKVMLIQKQGGQQYAVMDRW